MPLLHYLPSHVSCTATQTEPPYIPTLTRWHKMASLRKDARLKENRHFRDGRDRRRSMSVQVVIPGHSSLYRLGATTQTSVSRLFLQSVKTISDASRHAYSSTLQQLSVVIQTSQSQEHHGVKKRREHSCSRHLQRNRQPDNEQYANRKFNISAASYRIRQDARAESGR